MPECRYCGKWYKSNKGLNLHITKMHTSEGPFGNRIVDIGTIDPIGAMEERGRRFNNRRNKSGMFNFL